MGSEGVAVHALKEEEFAQITVLGVHVSFPNGIALSFVLRQVLTIFPVEIHLRPTKVKIRPVGFHVRPDLGGVVFSYTPEVLFGENLCTVQIRLLSFLASLFFSTGHAKCFEFKKDFECLGFGLLPSAVFDNLAHFGTLDSFGDVFDTVFELFLDRPGAFIR
ncbi:hypothetical protein Tco_0097872 [Tanacetum coccineum]